MLPKCSRLLGKNWVMSENVDVVEKCNSELSCINLTERVPHQCRQEREATLLKITLEMLANCSSTRDK